MIGRPEIAFRSVRVRVRVRVFCDGDYWHDQRDR
jgi:hypothetical protein